MSARRRKIEIAAGLMAVAEASAVAAFPEECCGILVGERLADGAGCRVANVLPARNVHPSDRRGAFRIPTEELLAAHKWARAEGLEVVGYYHSHPNGTAIPSEIDRQEAFPGTSHLLLSVGEAGAIGRRSWRLGEGERFEEEEVEVASSLEPVGERR